MLLIIALFKWRSDFIKADEIKEYEEITEGLIIDYYVLGEASPYVKFEYEVKGKKYTKTETPNLYLIGCEKTKDCIGSKYLVKYSRKNPKNSTLLIK